MDIEEERYRTKRAETTITGPYLVASPNPEYWHEQAQDCHEVASLLAKHCRNSMAVRKELYHQCHAALERQLKAVLACQGQLSDMLARTHSLNALAQNAGLWDELNALQEDFLLGFSGMHTRTNYPEEESVRRIWSSDAEVSIMIKRYGELRSLFERHYLMGREAGGQDGGNCAG